MTTFKHASCAITRWLGTVIVTCTVSALMVGCGSDTDPLLAAAPATTTKVRVVQMSYQTALPRYKGLANDTPSDVTLGMNPGATYSDGPTFSGYVIAGVSLPSLTGWGVTPWVEIPAGRHSVPFLPDNIGNPRIQEFEFVAGTEVSFVLRDFKSSPWEAVPLPVAALIPADQIELGILRVAVIVNDAGSAGSLSNRLRVEIVSADEKILATRETDDSALFRIPAAPFRVNVYELEATGKRLLRSELITLAGGARWSGNLFVRDVDGIGRSVVFYSDKSSKVTVAVDERAELRLINLTLFDLPLHIPQTGLTATSTVTVPRFSSFRSFSLGSAESKLDWDAAIDPIFGPSIATPAGSTVIPKIAAGRGYTLIFLEGAADRSVVRPVGFEHAYSHFRPGETTCLMPRILNALVVPETPASFSFQVMETALYQANVGITTPRLPIMPAPLGTLMVGQGASCNPSATPFLLAAMTVAYPPTGRVETFPSAILYSLPQRSSGATTVDSGQPLVEKTKGFVPAVNVIATGSGSQVILRGTGDFR